MTDKRYRLTLTGYARAGSLYEESTGLVIPSALVNAAGVEVLPTPLPTSPGSVLVNASGAQFVVTRDGVMDLDNFNNWDPSELNPAHFTVLFDAGVKR